MQSNVPSGPKPTKEAYLNTLRILKEQHVSLDEPARSPTSKSFKSRIVLCSEDVVHPHHPETKPVPANNNQNNRHVPSAVRLGAKHTVKIEEPVVQQSKAVKISSGASKKHTTVTQPAEPEMVSRFGRKATLRFQILSKRMPKYRLDFPMKQKIATELKNLQCWSDDDDFESMKVASTSRDSNEESDSDGSYGFEEKTPKAVPVITTKQPAQVTQSTKNVGFHGASVKENGPDSSPKANKSSKSGKQHAYLEEQKEKQRAETRDRIIKKAVKLLLKMRKEEEEAFKRRQLEGQSKLTPQQKLAIQKIAAMRVNRMIARGLSSAVEIRVKSDRRERRRIAREKRSYLIIATAYRKYRVRYLLQCVIDFIREKAARFRADQLKEDRDFRMRTAMRRVREDSALKTWQEDQVALPTFPVKPTAPGAARVDTFLQSIQKETFSTLRRSRYVFNLGTSTADKEALAAEAAERAAKAKKATIVPPAPAVAVPVPTVEGGEVLLTQCSAAKSIRATAPAPAEPAVSSSSKASTPKARFVVSKVVPKTAEQLHFEYHRPDLAPFSTRINNMISGSLLFQQKAEPSWMDVASVSSDYLATFKAAKKSPAYSALEKLCGISQEEVMRSKLISHKEGVDLKLKSFGHSIVSL